MMDLAAEAAAGSDSGGGSVVSKRSRSKQTRMTSFRINNKNADIAAIAAEAGGPGSTASLSEMGGSGRDFIEGNKALFLRAYDYVRPSAYFRILVHLYGNRKLLIVFWINVLASMIIGLHFALIKYDEMKETVDASDTNHYWMKVLFQPIEYGSIHSILFQMALIPLTMSRYSIAAMSDSTLDQFVPLNRMDQIHSYLGYTVVLIVTCATVVFFTLSTFLCQHDADAEACERITSDAMLIGYVVVGCLLFVAITSFLRHRIPYELFYAVHCLVFVLYGLVIAHTFDLVQRHSLQNLSHSFLLFSATLLIYVCDRFALRLNQTFRARGVSASSMEGGDGSRLLLIKIRRPILFRFKPGQYAFLRLPAVDRSWHPFSIASNPSSRFLEFYIQVYGPESWTGRLWDVLKAEGSGPLLDRSLEFEVMGPVGTSLGNTKDFSHGLAIGAGTGIIPVLSLFKQHLRNILQTTPGEHFRVVDENRKLRSEYEVAVDSRKGSFAGLWSSSWKSKSDLSVGAAGGRPRDRDRGAMDGVLKKGHVHKSRKSTKELKRAALGVSLSIYGLVLLSIITVFGVAVLGLTISWNCLSIELYPWMKASLKIMTIVFQVCFAVPALFIWDGNNFLSFVDFLLCLLMVPASMRWFQTYDEGKLQPVELFICSLVTAYMTARLWWVAVAPSHKSWKNSPSEDNRQAMERLEVVWTSSSSALISQLFPEISDLWDQVVNKWGLENAFKVARFDLYITDTDERAARQLRSELADTSLYQRGMVSFGHPDFSEIIENHSLEMVNESGSSNTLLAFCGPPELDRTIQRLKVFNDMLVETTGNNKHIMEYVSDTHGGVKYRKPKRTKGGSNNNNSSSEESGSDSENVTRTTTRQVTNFDSYQDPNDPEDLEMILSQSRAHSP